MNGRTVQVAVGGPDGRMGSEVIKAVSAEEDMEVILKIDRGFNLKSIHPEDDHKPDIYVSFTKRDAALVILPHFLKAGIHCLVGTTGIENEEYEQMLEGAPEGTILYIVPNFAIGAVLMMKFAEQAAKYFPHAEIIELHHDQKTDAPSGTAKATAKLIDFARPHPRPIIPGWETKEEMRARGAAIWEIPVHSVRLPGLVAHQEVLFGGTGQTLTVRHDSIDRTSFMPGVICAIRAIAEDRLKPGHSVGLELVLNS